VRASLCELDAMQRARDARREDVGLPIDEFRRVDHAFAIAGACLEEDSLPELNDFVIRRQSCDKAID
jgi:hypothetical protein